MNGSGPIFPRRLRRDILILLAAKACALAALYVAFFDAKPVADSSRALAQHLLEVPQEAR